MSVASPESALALQQSILGHDTWDQSQPELAGFTRLGFVAISGGMVKPDQLPEEVRTRLGVTDTSAPDECQYQLDLGRRHDRRYEDLSDMYDVWPKGKKWDQSVYDDYGTDSAFVRVSRLGEGVMLSASYLVSAEESFEPGQQPLCDVRVETEDHMPMRQRMIDLRNSGGGILELAAVLGIDPMTGEKDLDKPEVTSDTDLWAKVAEEMGTPLTQPEIDRLREDEVVGAEMRAAETELQPLTDTEIFGLATLVRSVKTYGQC